MAGKRTAEDLGIKAAKSVHSLLNAAIFQYWMLSKEGEIRRDEACMDYAGTDVILYPCHGSKGNQYWEYNPEVRG